MSKPSPKEQLVQRFAEDAAKRQAMGLPQKQAELVALRQLVRDARGGLLDEDLVRAILVEEEIKAGRSKEAAKAHADAVLAGESSPWAERDFGFQKSRRRRPGGDHPGMSAPLEVEDITHRFFGQKF